MIIQKTTSRIYEARQNGIVGVGRTFSEAIDKVIGAFDKFSFLIPIDDECKLCDGTRKITKVISEDNFMIVKCPECNLEEYEPNI